jgi:hypothetical protein
MEPTTSSESKLLLNSRQRIPAAGARAVFGAADWLGGASGLLRSTVWAEGPTAGENRPATSAIGWIFGPESSPGGPAAIVSSSLGSIGRSLRFFGGAAWRGAEPDPVDTSAAAAQSPRAFAGAHAGCYGADDEISTRGSRDRSSGDWSPTAGLVSVPDSVSVHAGGGAPLVPHLLHDPEDGG